MTWPTWTNPTMKQTWAVLPALINKMCTGMSLGIASSVMREAQHQPTSTRHHMDLDTASWFASLMGISMIFGFFVTSCLMYNYGRRIAILTMCVPALVSSYVIFTDDVTSMMVFRVLTGFSVGGVGVTSVIMTGECASPRNRGMFLNLMSVSMNTGSLLMHVAGNYATSRNLTIIVAVPYVICFCITYTSPESPSWLAERKRFEKSREAFYWLRGRTEETTREIEELIRAQSHKTIEKSIMQQATDFILKFKKRNFLKPYFLIVLAILLSEVSGRHVFPAYAAQLIREIASDEFNPFYYNILLDLLILSSGVLSSYLIRVLRLRCLLFATGAVAVFTLMLTSISLYYLNNGLLSVTWLPLVLFASYFVISNLSCSSVLIVLLGEIFPLEHRIVGTTSGTYTLSFVMAVALKIMPQMVITFHIYGAFAIMGACMTVLLIILYFVLPETTNRTLQQIENSFEQKKMINDDEESMKLNTHC